jgi:hypothetical protein
MKSIGTPLTYLTKKQNVTYIHGESTRALPFLGEAPAPVYRRQVKGGGFRVM